MAKSTPARKPPPEAYLLNLRQECETRFRAQDLQIRHGREVRELRQVVPIDKDLLLVPGLQVRDPTATNAGFQAADTLSLNWPSVTVTPAKRESDTAQALSTDMEYWLEGVMKECGKLPLSMHAFAAGVDSAVNDGAAWHKLVWRPDKWAVRNALRVKQFTTKGESPEEAARKFEAASEDAKRSAGPPFSWMVPDPLTCYPVFYGDELGEVLEVTERPESRLFRQYRLARDRSGGILLPEQVAQGIPTDENRTRTSYETAGGVVTFLEHWDSEFVTYAVIGRQLSEVTEADVPRTLKQWRHHYGRVPYFPAMGLMMSHWRNRKVGWGITEAMRFFAEFRSFLWTLMGNMAARDTFPLLQEVFVGGAAGPAGAALTTQGDDQRSDRPAIIRWGLREIMRARTGYEYKPMPMPEVAETIKILMAAVDHAMERMEPPRMTGFGGLEGAGFAVNQVLSYEAVRLGQVKRNLETSLEDMARFYIDLTNGRVREKVWVFSDSRSGNAWIGLGPNELTGAVNITVRLAPEQPSAKLIEQRMVHEAIDKKTLSLDQAIEMLGRNPDEVRRGRRMDQIRESPLYEKLADQALLAELGRGDLVALTLQAEMVAQQGEPQSGVPAPAGVQAMGNEIVPDMGNLATSAGASGARLSPNPPGTPSMAGPPQGSQVGEPVTGAQPITG